MTMPKSTPRADARTKAVLCKFSGRAPVGVNVRLLVSNRKRAILVLSVVPLMAFSCATVDALRVMPSRYSEAVTAGAYTVSLASADYTDVAKVVEGWAVAEGSKSHHVMDLISEPHFVRNFRATPRTLPSRIPLATITST